MIEATVIVKFWDTKSKEELPRQRDAYYGFRKFVTIPNSGEWVELFDGWAMFSVSTREFNRDGSVSLIFNVGETTGYEIINAILKKKLDV
jgi:hypothetical protein